MIDNPRLRGLCEAGERNRVAAILEPGDAGAERG
jgi:hypothetical protein